MLNPTTDPVKTKGKFLVGDITKDPRFWRPEAQLREWGRWPDVADDHYQIRLPYLSDSALQSALSSPEVIFSGRSAQSCGIAGIIGPRSPYRLRRVVEQLARYFRREFNYDFIQFAADESDHKDDHRAYFWVDHRRSEYRAHQPFYPVIGACCFRHRHYEERPDRANSPLYQAISRDCYRLQWIWFHPFARNHGHLTKALPYFLARFGRLLAEGPYSPAMENFLKKHHQYPFETAEQEAAFYGATHRRIVAEISHAES
jgi:hypothetical protein